MSGASRTAIRRLFGVLLSRDGQAPALEAAALDAGEEMAARAAIAGGRPHRAVPHPKTIIAASLASKLLHGWMQNRYQTRYPLILNMRNHSQIEAELLTQIVRRALRSTEASGEALERARAWVAGVGGTLGRVDEGDDEQLIDRIHAARLGPQAYAACAGALGRRNVADRRFLDFLAARLGVPDDVARSLNRRFAS